MRSPNPMNLLATKKNVDRLRRFKLKLTRPDRSTSPQRLEAAAATLQLSSGGPPSPVELLGHRVEALRVSARHAVVAPLEVVEIPISTDPEPTPSTEAPPRQADESAAAPDDESRPAERDHTDDDESTSESESPASDSPSSSSAASSGRKRDAGGSQQPSTGGSPPLGDADRFEELVEHEHREKLMRAWRRTHRFRTVPCPSAPPLYLNEPLELMWSETDTVTRRRLFNRNKYADTPHASPPRKNMRAGDQRTPPPPPLKANRTYHLRNAFAKRQPIVSAYFERHYTAHRKPPFKRFNVKFVN